jgi:hypothetical protein
MPTQPIAAIRTFVLQCAAPARRPSTPHLRAAGGFSVIDVNHTHLYGNDQSDCWFMQTVLQHSSSPPAREAAAAWVGAYDAALALGAAASRAQVLADAAYRATASVTGLPTGDWRRQ